MSASPAPIRREHPVGVAAAYIGVTISVALLSLGAWAGAYSAIHGGFLEWDHTPTQDDITAYLETGVVVGVVVMAIASLLGWTARRRSAPGWWRYPALLVAAYALTSSLSIFAELYPSGDGWTGPLIESVAVAAWSWLLLGVGMVVVSALPRRFDGRVVAASVSAFVVAVAVIGTAVLVQDDVAARSVDVAAAPPATAANACVVVGGDRGVVVRASTGGWSTVRLRPAPSLIGVATDGARWVVVGDGSIGLSRDGVHWSRAASADDLHDVATDTRRWVVVGDSGVIRTSRDARSWRRVASGTHRTLHAVATDGTRWVVVGDGVVLTSRDTVTWRRIALPYGLNAVDQRDGRWVAVGGSDVFDSDEQQSGVVLESNDGADWSVVETSPAEMVEVGVGAPGWLAVGSMTVMSEGQEEMSAEGRVFASADGETWTLVSRQPLDAVAWDGHEWVGQFDGDVSTSADGSSWAVAHSSFPLSAIAARACT